MEAEIHPERASYVRHDTEEKVKRAQYCWGDYYNDYNDEVVVCSVKDL